VVDLIWVNHRKSGYLGWDTDRVNRICQLLQMTVFELCAHAGERRVRQVMKHQASGMWPAYLTKQFQMWERFARLAIFCEEFLPTVSEVAMIKEFAKSRERQALAATRENMETAERQTLIA